MGSYLWLGQFLVMHELDQGMSTAVCFLNKQEIPVKIYPVWNTAWKIHLVELVRSLYLICFLLVLYFIKKKKLKFRLLTNNRSDISRTSTLDFNYLYLEFLPFTLLSN